MVQLARHVFSSPTQQTNFQVNTFQQSSTTMQSRSCKSDLSSSTAQRRPPALAYKEICFQTLTKRVRLRAPEGAHSKGTTWQSENRRHASRGIVLTLQMLKIYMDHQHRVVDISAEMNQSSPCEESLRCFGGHGWKRAALDIVEGHKKM